MRCRALQKSLQPLLQNSGDVPGRRASTKVGTHLSILMFPFSCALSPWLPFSTGIKTWSHGSAVLPVGTFLII